MDVARARIESLNPLVVVETMTSPSALEREEFDALVESVDLVCITDSERDFLVSSWLGAPRTLFVVALGQRGGSPYR